MATTFRSDGFTAFPKDPVYQGGKKIRSIFFRKTVTSGTSAVNDIMILSGPHSLDDKIIAVKGVTPALTSATSNNLGFYQKLADGTFAPYVAAGGAELFSAVDLTAAKAYGDILELNAALNRTANIGALMSMTSENELTSGVYVGLKTTVANTAASVVLALEVCVEEANTK